MKILLRSFNLRVWSFFLIILFFIFKCTDSYQNGNIAQIGNLYVSTHELKNIAQFNPFLSSIKDDISTKKYLLNALIAEKIFVLEANKRNLIKDEKLLNLINQYKCEAIIEKFWQDEIFNKINISEEELKDAYFKSKEKRVIKFLQFNKKEQAIRIKKYLDNKKSFENLDYSLSNNVSTDTIEYVGKLPTFEDSVFNMTTENKIKLIKEGSRYFLVELQNIIRNIFTAEDDFNRAKRKLNKMLKQKKSIQNYNIYQKKYFKPYLYKLNNILFKELVQKIDRYLFENTIEQDTETENISQLMENGFLGSLSDLSIIQFNDGDDWTVKDLITRMSVSPYPVDFKNRGKFRTSMIAATKHILDDEVIVKHAIGLNLDNTNYVKAETQMWKDYILYDRMVKNLDLNKTINVNSQNSVSLSKLDDYLTQKLNEYELRINYSVLDTLQISKTDMVVLKSHFPQRTIVPLIQPLNNLPRFTQSIENYRQ